MKPIQSFRVRLTRKVWTNDQIQCVAEAHRNWLLRKERHTVFVLRWGQAIITVGWSLGRSHSRVLVPSNTQHQQTNLLLLARHELELALARLNELLVFQRAHSYNYSTLTMSN